MSNAIFLFDTCVRESKMKILMHHTNLFKKIVLPFVINFAVAGLWRDGERSRDCYFQSFGEKMPKKSGNHQSIFWFCYLKSSRLDNFYNLFYLFSHGGIKASRNWNQCRIVSSFFDWIDFFSLHVWDSFYQFFLSDVGSWFHSKSE